MRNLWAACEGISEGDLVLAPKPDRTYRYGLVTGGYEYRPGTDLPHRRRVDWTGSLSRDDVSQTLASSAGSLMTVFQLTAHRDELATLTQLADPAQPIVQAISLQGPHPDRKGDLRADGDPGAVALSPTSQSPRREHFW